MTGIVCMQIADMARGEKNSVDIDWGENTPGQETGILKAGDTVTSCTVSVATDASGNALKPSGAADPTFSGVVPNSQPIVVLGRTCSAGEATTFTITMAANQTAGQYIMKVVASTANGFILPRNVRVNVVVL